MTLFRLYITLKVDIFFEEFEFTSDSDLDGILNEEDAFPLDAAASVDTDQDGYPDYWNADKSQADSTTRLKLDEFPTEYLCWHSTQGTNGVCDYAKSSYGDPHYGAPNEIVSAGDRVYLLYSKVILVWSLAEQRFLTPIYFKKRCTFLIQGGTYCLFRYITAVISRL